MIAPRRVILSSDDSYLISAAKVIGITSDELFFKLESIKNVGEINKFHITKKNSENNFSYVIKNMEETIRIVCAF